MNRFRIAGVTSPPSLSARRIVGCAASLSAVDSLTPAPGSSRAAAAQPCAADASDCDRKRSEHPVDITMISHRDHRGVLCRVSLSPENVRDAVYGDGLLGRARSTGHGILGRGVCVTGSCLRGVVPPDQRGGSAHGDRSSGAGAADERAPHLPDRVSRDPDLIGHRWSQVGVTLICPSLESTVRPTGTVRDGDYPAPAVGRA